jgi:hypothetical protein
MNLAHAQPPGANAQKCRLIRFVFPPTLHRPDFVAIFIHHIAADQLAEISNALALAIPSAHAGLRRFFRNPVKHSKLFSCKLHIASFGSTKTQPAVVKRNETNLFFKTGDYPHTSYFFFLPCVPDALDIPRGSESGGRE